MFDFDKNNKVIDKSPTYDLIMRLPRGRGSPEYVPDFGNVARAGGGHPSAPRPPGSLALAPSASPTPSANDSRFVRVGNTDGDPVRVRSLPSRTAPAITSVAEGTRVLALGVAQRGDDLFWQKVRIGNGTEGWIAADFLTPD
jgi:hypothetical protein